MRHNGSKVTKVIATYAVSFFLVMMASYYYSENVPAIGEYTFVSGFIVGMFFFITCFFIFFEKRVPQILYLCALIAILIQLVDTFANVGEFTFEEGYLFTHYINPIIVLVYFFVACDLSKTKIRLVPLVAVFPVLYLVFALVYGHYTGNYIYDIFNYEEAGVGYTALISLAILAGALALGFALYFLNRFVRKLADKRIPPQPEE